MNIVLPSGVTMGFNSQADADAWLAANPNSGAVDQAQAVQQTGAQDINALKSTLGQTWNDQNNPAAAQAILQGSGSMPGPQQSIGRNPAGYAGGQTPSGYPSAMQQPAGLLGGMTQGQGLLAGYQPISYGGGMFGSGMYGPQSPAMPGGMSNQWLNSPGPTWDAPQAQSGGISGWSGGQTTFMGPRNVGGYGQQQGWGNTSHNMLWTR